VGPRSGGFHEWACFAAQQAAEKGLKAVYQSLAGEAWGHSVAKLLEGLAERVSVTPQLLDAGRDLDRYYIPARYPNGWAAGAPKDMIREEDAALAIRRAEEVLRFCHGLLARP
jgi:HEPN domain-containing protein